MDRYQILGAGGHATTYRSDADLSWGLLAPPLLPRGWEPGCTPSALLHSWAAVRTLAGHSSRPPVLVSRPNTCVGWWLAAVAAQLAVHTSAATEPWHPSRCRVRLVADPSRLKVHALVPLLCPGQHTQPATLLQGTQDRTSWPEGGHSL